MFPIGALRITVVDADDRHIYQPGLVFVPFGLADAEEIVRPRGRQLHAGIDYVQAEIARVDAELRQVHLVGGDAIEYDVLVIASGAVLMPQETEGLSGSEWNRSVFTFYELESAMALCTALDGFTQGRIVVDVVDMPIKCPVAPLEFCFLADWFFHERGVRDSVDITYATPLDGAFTRPVAAAHLGRMLEEKHVNMVTEFNAGSIDNERRVLVSYDGREIPFDLAVVVPLHGGAPYIRRSPGLGDELDFVRTDIHTLQADAAPNIFVIGDAAGLPTSKAGSVTHFEAEVLVENIRRFLANEPLDASYDGHANCFIETGFHKAILVDFNYDMEPVPGHFPMGVGLPLLKESHLNHLGKLMFEWFYWHTLLPGHSIPGIGSDMPTRGKQAQVAGAAQGGSA
jgi:sulfide:quinone oxidoreductase